MAKKIFITGISGFAGSHLAEYLISKKNFGLYGTYLGEKSLRNIINIKDKIHLARLNLLEKEKVDDFIKKTKPDLLFHLAALTSPSDSFKDPAATIMNNVTAQVNLLEAIRIVSSDTKILIVSSADVYGRVGTKDLPIDEETKFTPTNPYAVSKITQDFLGLQYFLSYNLKVIRVRPFNHIGPRQSPGFVVADFAKKIAEIEKGQKEPVLRAGNLEAKRDLTDVRDMVRAYLLGMEKGKVGDVYNIGSGISYKISDILSILLSFSKVKIKVESEPSLLWPGDVLDRISDSKKFIKLTGWKPSIPIKETLKDTLDYWRNIV